MMLSDRDIATELRDGGIRVDPAPEGYALQPASIDLRLGEKFRVLPFSLGVVDPENPPEGEEVNLSRIANARFSLAGGAFVLAHTLEVVTIGSHLAAQVGGKSSLGRLGLDVHATAGFIDPGYSGQVTFELFNKLTCPIVLRPGMKIGQIVFWELRRAAERPYGTAGLGSRYVGDRGAVAARPERGAI